MQQNTRKVCARIPKIGHEGCLLPGIRLAILIGLQASLLMQEASCQDNSCAPSSTPDQSHG